MKHLFHLSPHKPEDAGQDDDEDMDEDINMCTTTVEATLARIAGSLKKLATGCKGIFLYGQ